MKRACWMTEKNGGTRLIRGVKSSRSQLMSLTDYRDGLTRHGGQRVDSDRRGRNEQQREKSKKEQQDEGEKKENLRQNEAMWIGRVRRRR